jgi:NAD(P)H-hydrate epimerase
MPGRALSRDEVRDVDHRAIEDFGMPGIVLMENAGRGAAELLTGLGIQGPVVVVAGKGNNAGDGFVIARHLESAGIEIEVLLACEPNQLRGDAAVNFKILRLARTPLQFVTPDLPLEELNGLLSRADWVIDALLGTGTRGAIQDPLASLIERINAKSDKILAVDLPSGLDCDTGRPLGPCVRANHTATFVARKLGFEAPKSREFTGTVHVIGIGIPKTLLDELQ